MQLRHDDILVNDVFTLLAIRHALNDAKALRSLSSILEPPQTLKRHAKRTSWSKKNMDAWIYMGSIGQQHTCMQRALHEYWMHEKKRYNKPQILVQYHGAMYAFGQGGSRTAPLQEVYAWEVGGRRQGFHLKAVQISIVLKLSCSTSPGQTIEGQQGHPCTHPNLQQHGAWEIQRIDSSGTFSGWWSLSIVNGIFLTVRGKQKPCTDTCMHGPNASEILKYGQSPFTPHNTTYRVVLEPSGKVTCRSDILCAHAWAKHECYSRHSMHVKKHIAWIPFS